MDFIESLFGIAPDGGDGSLEAMLIGAIVVVALMFVFRRRIIAARLAKDEPSLRSPPLAAEAKAGAGTGA